MLVLTNRGGSGIVYRKLFYRITRLSWSLLFMTTIILILFSTLIMPVIEPDTFPDYITSFWFTMTTLLSVGYGDVSPVTTAGKLFTVFILYLFGIGLIASFIGKIFDSIGLFRKQRERGELVYAGKNHIVIVDWSHKAKNAINEIFERDEEVEIVVIDNIDKAKDLHERIHFVRGDATDGQILLKANVVEAKAILIFADDKIHDQMLTDGKSLIIATAVERLQSNVHITVEVEREEHLPNFAHIKVDNFILSDATIARLAVDSVLKKSQF